MRRASRRESPAGGDTGVKIETRRCLRCAAKVTAPGGTTTEAGKDAVGTEPGLDVLDAHEARDQQAEVHDQQHERSRQSRRSTARCGSGCACGRIVESRLESLRRIVDSVHRCLQCPARCPGESSPATIDTPSVNASAERIGRGSRRDARNEIVADTRMSNWSSTPLRIKPSTPPASEGGSAFGEELRDDVAAPRAAARSGCRFPCADARKRATRLATLAQAISSTAATAAEQRRA